MHICGIEKDGTDETYLQGSNGDGHRKHIFRYVQERKDSMG